MIDNSTIVLLGIYVLYFIIAWIIYSRLYVSMTDRFWVKVRCLLISLTWIISIPITFIIFAYIVNKNFLKLFLQIIWLFAKVSAAFLVAYYAFVDDITKATFYVAIMCLFVLIELRDESIKNDDNG